MMKMRIYEVYLDGQYDSMWKGLKEALTVAYSKKAYFDQFGDNTKIKIKSYVVTLGCNR